MKQHEKTNIKSSEITVVIQGPIHSYENRVLVTEDICEKCIQSIRRVLPESKIILSTWEGSDASNLDYDELILNKDPGVLSISAMTNTNRQIRSTINGLKRVQTKYAIKMRTDNYLTDKSFIEIFEKYGHCEEEFSFFSKRLVSIDLFARNLDISHLYFPFHPSDFFFFGKTSDLIKLWDIPCARIKKGVNKNIFNKKISPEQYLWLSFLKKFSPIFNKVNIDEISDKQKEISNKTIAHNLIICSSSQIGLKCPKHENLLEKDLHFHEALKITTSLLKFPSWIKLNNKYCRKKIPFNIKSSFELVKILFNKKILSLILLILDNIPYFIKSILKKIHAFLQTIKKRFN